MGGTCNTDGGYFKFKSLVGKLEEKRPVEDLGAEGKENNKVDLKGIG
jgi:hypothetical protein